jgi:cell wall-associated NlpC family hydrolase
MTHRIAPRAYINLMVGKPYLQGSDDLENGGIDCFGIIKDGFERVRDIEIPSPAERINIASAGADEIASDRWIDSSKEGADIFACYDANQTMTHCGLILAGVALHAIGDGDTGQVMSWSTMKLERLYNRNGGSVVYYRYNYAQGS